MCNRYLNILQLFAKKVVEGCWCVISVIRSVYSKIILLLILINLIVYSELGLNISHLTTIYFSISATQLIL